MADNVNDHRVFAFQSGQGENMRKVEGSSVYQGEHDPEKEVEVHHLSPSLNYLPI